MSHVVSTARKVWNSEFLRSTVKILFLGGGGGGEAAWLGVFVWVCDKHEKEKFSGGLNTAL